MAWGSIANTCPHPVVSRRSRLPTGAWRFTPNFRQNSAQDKLSELGRLCSMQGLKKVAECPCFVQVVDASQYLILENLKSVLAAFIYFSSGLYKQLISNDNLVDVLRVKKYT